jgi:8-oxo-dGTP diphosphatase
VRGVTETADPQYRWTFDAVPAGRRVGQVYGWLFDGHGPVLVQETTGGWNLPGGSPEPVDTSCEATLRREALEESQVEIGVMAYHGYEWDPRERETALARYAGLISAFRPRHPDPDDGRLHGRWLMLLEDAVHLLSWADSGRSQGAAAAAIATGRWGIPADRPTAPPEHVD